MMSALRTVGTGRMGLGLLLVRILVGWVFLSEGIQKFLFPSTLGYGRFEKIGIPQPHLLAPFVGDVEVICGVLLILGLFTGMATILLLLDIGVALWTTKFPMLAKQGFWPAMHESRVDFCMLVGLLAIALMGAGGFSLDGSIRRR